MDDEPQRIDESVEDHMVAIRARHEEIMTLQQRAIEQLTILIERQRGK